MRLSYLLVTIAAAFIANGDVVSSALTNTSVAKAAADGISLRGAVQNDDNKFERRLEVDDDNDDAGETEKSAAAAHDKAKTEESATDDNDDEEERKISVSAMKNLSKQLSSKQTDDKVLYQLSLNRDYRDFVFKHWVDMGKGLDYFNNRFKGLEQAGAVRVKFWDYLTEAGKVN